MAQLPREWQQKIAWICTLSNADHITQQVLSYMSKIPLQFFELERKTRQVIDSINSGRIKEQAAIVPKIEIERISVNQPTPYEVINIESLAEQKVEQPPTIITEKIFPNTKTKRPIKKRVSINVLEPFTITPIQNTTKPNEPSTIKAEETVQEQSV